MSLHNPKNIDEFTKEELFKFYNEVRSYETFHSDGYTYFKPNEDLLNNIDSMVREMEKRK